MLTRNNQETLEAGRLLFREPCADDGPAVYALIECCKPLDLNSRYCYLILCEHFHASCVVATIDDAIVGVVTAYVPPNKPDTLFVWQVAVDANMRGQGLAKRMLRELLARGTLQHIRTIEATVGPSNHASRALFHAIASEHQAKVDESLLFATDLLGAGEHEQENLIRVSPLSGQQIQP